MRLFIHFVLWLVGFSAAFQSGAQAPPATALTLRQAIDAAWERSPDNPAAAGRLRRAEADREVAAAPWAASPALELATRQGRAQPDGTSREHEVGVSWPLWLPGQRTAREAAASAEVLAAGQALRAARLKVATDVREAQVALLEQEAEIREAESQQRALLSLADDVDRRVAAGDLARVDAMAARAELLAVTNTLRQSRQRLREAQLRWAALTGLPSAPPPQPWQAPTGSGDEHPELALAVSNLAAARSRLAAVERSGREPPELGVRVRRETAPFGAGSENSVGVSLRVPFATESRNQPLLAAALADVEQAQVQEQRVRERLALDIEGARAAVTAADEQLDVERTRATLLRERATLLERSFRAGETSLPETLRALALATQAEAAVQRQQAAQFRAQARLDQILGRMP